ncbi:MAG: hypothetical protein WKF71_01840 [Pyrinomonadaceae bacterium]
MNPPSTAWETIVDNATSGRFSASSNWATSSYSSQRYGADYRYANPQAVSDAAWFSANIPSAGNYQIYVWYPANSGYNSATPFVVSTSTGSQTVSVNQQINGGAWVSIGTFALERGRPERRRRQPLDKHRRLRYRRRGENRSAINQSPLFGNTSGTAICIIACPRFINLCFCLTF